MSRHRGICKIDGCHGERKGRGMCSKHYQRWANHGDPFYERPGAPKCIVEGCHEKNWSKGYCQHHYAKWRRHGDPLWTRDNQCRMTQCWKKQHGLGLCTTHYFRWRKYEDPWFDGKHYPECKIEGCYKPTGSRGWCNTHYARWREHGDPLHEAAHTQPMGVDLPMAPLLELVMDRGGFNAVLDAAGLVFQSGEWKRIEKYVDRARARRVIDLAFADHFAVKVIGTHPALIWGEDYWAAEAHEIEEVEAA